MSMAIVVTQIPVEQMEAAENPSDFQLDGTTLVKYTGTATAVSVPAEVKKIGEEAFAGNTTIQSVKLPDDLETIEYGAFGYCSSLKKIQIPDKVTKVGSGAFACCTSLSTVTLGAEVKELGNGVFAGCTALKGVKLGKNTRFQMKDGALYDKDTTKLYQYFCGYINSDYVMPSTVEEIGVYAFWGCNNLKAVVLNSEMNTIAGYAFSNCASLNEIQIPYSVTTIGAKAFEDCAGLTNVTLPPSVRTIHETAFDGCVNLTLTGSEGSAGGEFAKEFNSREKVVQTEYEDIIDTETVAPKEPSTEEEPKKETETEPVQEEEPVGNVLGSTVIVGNQAVVFIDNTTMQQHEDTSVQIYEPEAQTTEIASEEEREEVEGLLQVEEKGLHIPKFTITADGIVANQAYYKRMDLTSFEIPEGTKEIGEFSFARSGLISVTIPEGVTKIGYGAFYHCDNLNQIVLPSTIESIEPEAFEKTGFIENWKKSGSSTFLTAGNGILLAYNGAETTVTIPDGVRIVAPGVFAKHEEIQTVVLPDSLEIIGEGAFEGCSGLEQISGGINLLQIQDRAFAGCPIQTIRIPDKVQSIGLKAFDVTGTGRTQDAKTVVFHGFVIPKLSYGKMAQRLSNASYRGKALEGVDVAVIEPGVSVDRLKGTVLDSSQHGFKGIIISLNDDTTMTAVLRGTTLTAEELKSFTVPETVEVYGRQYVLEDMRQLEVLAAANTDSSYNNEGSVLILNKVPDLQTAQMKAELGISSGTYYLSVSQNEQAARRLEKAYQAVFDLEPPENLTVLELSLLEENSGVPIQKLGKQNIRVTLPTPEGLGEGRLYVLTTDENGQLETLPCWYENDGGRICFETNHFSPFGFYTAGGSNAEKDDSPDTGDLIHPKWFLAGGLFFSAFALFFYRKKPHKIVK